MDTELAGENGNDPRKIRKLVPKCVPTFLSLEAVQGNRGGCGLEIVNSALP